MILRNIARFVLWITGWKLSDQAVQIPDKAVIIGVPHTSNWDFVYFIAFKWRYGLNVRFMGKKSLFRPPLGWFMRGVGGISIDRTSAHNVVDQMALAFKENDKLLLAIAPSATRSKRDYWKSGFYHIALAADVPVFLGWLDFQTKTGCFGVPMSLTGNVKEDMDKIRAHYSDKFGKRPEKTSTIRLRLEDKEE